jgi:hypothetical protein
MYILVGKQQTYDNITGFILGVTPPESYFYPRVPSVNYRLLDSFTVHNKELKLTWAILSMATDFRNSIFNSIAGRYY